MMHQTEWIQIEDECFEECEIVLSNGESLFTIRRWDRDTRGKDCPKDLDIKPMGNVRVSFNGKELFFTPLYISRGNLIRRVRDHLGLPLNDLKNIMGIKTPHIYGLLPKKFKQETEKYLND